MAAEREPPPLGDGRQTEFEELEDGEDLFTSTVSTLEVGSGRRPQPLPERAPLTPPACHRCLLASLLLPGADRWPLGVHPFGLWASSPSTPPPP